MANKSTIVRTIQTIAPIASAVAPPLASRWLARLFTTPMRFQAPERERAWLATADRSTLAFDGGLEMPIYSWGSGPTVLLVHGWSGRGSQMGVYAAPLVERGFRVISFDAPAHGEADGRVSALPEFAVAVQRVAEAVGPLHAIVAHSLGTAATSLALSRGVDAERLVYIAPPEDLPGYLARMAGTLGFGKSIAPRAQRRLEALYGVPFEEARGSFLAPGIDVPLLIVHDAGDDDVPYEEGARLAGLFPRAQLVTTKGLGHRRILRDEGVVEAAVDFLAGQQREHSE